jgi:hypothetical protein
LYYFTFSFIDRVSGGAGGYSPGRRSQSIIVLSCSSILFLII